MISKDYCLTMARYNRWQNHLLFAEIAGLDTPPQPKAKALWLGTMSAQTAQWLWGDAVWLARLDGGAKPAPHLQTAEGCDIDWAELRRERQSLDARAVLWASRLGDDDLNGDLWWFCAQSGRSLSRPIELCILSYFNAQSLGRGRLIGQLGAVGGRRFAEDIAFMPEDLDWM